MVPVLGEGSFELITSRPGETVLVPFSETKGTRLTRSPRLGSCVRSPRTRGAAGETRFAFKLSATPCQFAFSTAGALLIPRMTSVHLLSNNSVMKIEDKNRLKTSEKLTFIFLGESGTDHEFRRSSHWPKDHKEDH